MAVLVNASRGRSADRSDPAVRVGRRRHVREDDEPGERRHRGHRAVDLVTGCTPLHLLEAPTPGSGKGLLADVVAIVALGRPCDPTTITPDEDEARKKITSILARAQPLILLDNVRDGLDSAQLASALTAETWSDRMLGQTRMIDLPNRATYRAALRAWKEYFGARDGQRAVRLDEITPARWLDYRAWRAKTRNSTHGTKTTVSARTLNADQQSVVRILNEAVIDGHLDANPLAGIKKLRETRRPRRYLTKEEIGRLIANCPEHFRPFVVTAVYTGARKGELTRLRWSDIDFAGARISLYRPKTGTADLLDLHPAVAAELVGLRESREAVLPDDHVFLSCRGTPFKEIRRSWALALKAAGLEGREGLTPHSTRHSFATHYLQNGGAVTDLQQQLGHAELATTQIYASALSGRRRATVMALDFAPTR